MKNQLEQLITTKELAEVLGVTDRTIRNTVEKLGNVLSSVATNSQGGFLFNERQATLIKQEIQSHHMHTNHTYTFREIAKELNKPSRGFASWLHQEGYVYSQNGAWIPYYGKEDLFEVKQTLINELFPKYTTHITQKGRCELLKKYGGNSIG